MSQPTELQILERELAYSVARADIETYCEFEVHNGERPRLWFKIDSLSDAGEIALVGKSVRYLELRELLKRDPKNANLVQILDEPAVAA